jgi:hypothetical protein
MALGIALRRVRVVGVHVDLPCNIFINIYLFLFIYVSFFSSTVGNYVKVVAAIVLILLMSPLLL